jgi:hypothetical protein
VWAAFVAADCVFTATGVYETAPVSPLAIDLHAYLRHRLISASLRSTN